jgi:uncharacterized protein YehS (DUF1456 family)
MTRYVQQRDNTSCGPIAIINALKWANVKVTYKDLDKYVKKCRSHLKLGTWPRHLIGVLSREKHLKVVYYPTLNLKKIDNILKSNNIVLVDYYYINKKHKYGHWFMIESFTNKKYNCINLYKRQTISYVSRSEMNKMLRMEDGWGLKACGIEVKKIIDLEK